LGQRAQEGFADISKPYPYPHSDCAGNRPNGTTVCPTLDKRAQEGITITITQLAVKRSDLLNQLANIADEIKIIDDIMEDQR